jgi:hypothetical protein
MSRLTILDEIRIASPCPAEWAEMAGDDRARFCSSCSKHVYNISAMTAEEAMNLIREREGRLCVQIYRRRDGTVLTADCPVGARLTARQRLRKILAALVLVPALLLAGIASAGIGRRRVEPFLRGPGITWDDRIDWALVALGLRAPYSRFWKGGLEDVIYIYPSPAFPTDNSQAKLQRKRMQEAGLPVPDEPGSPPPQ